MGGGLLSAFTSFWAFFEDGSQHHTKNGADSQHSQQQIWPSKSASTQTIQQIVSIRKKLNPQIQLIFSQALRDQTIKSVKTSSENSIVGLDYAPPFLELEKVSTPFTKTVKMCLSFNFHFEKCFAPPLPTLNNAWKDILSRVGRGVIDKSQSISPNLL